MAAMVWYHVYFIVVTMFGTRGQWALYPPQALYPTYPTDNLLRIVNALFIKAKYTRMKKKMMRKA